MAVATLVPVTTGALSNISISAQIVPFNFTHGAGSPSFDENYRILENGEARITEDEEVRELE